MVTGQGSSFEGEERKGVRKSEKGRKQTTLTSHHPLPLPDTPPMPSRIHIPSQGFLLPKVYVSLSLILQVNSKLNWKYFTFHWPAQLSQAQFLVWGQFESRMLPFTAFPSVYLNDLILTPYHPLINCCGLYRMLRYVDSRLHFYNYISSLDKYNLTCKRRHNLLDRSIPSEVQGAGSSSSLLKR